MGLRVRGFVLIVVAQACSCVDLSLTAECIAVSESTDVDQVERRCKEAWETESQPDAAVLWANAAAQRGDRSVAHRVLPDLDPRSVDAARIRYVVAADNESRGDSGIAEEQYQSALRTFELRKDWGRAAAVARTVGILRYRKGEYRKAIVSLEAAVSLASRAGDATNAADAQLTMAAVYAELGNASLSNLLTERALAAAPQHPRRPLIEGHRARENGRPKYATLRLEEGARRLSEWRDYDGAREVELTLVDLALEVGDVTAAVKHRDRARQALKASLSEGIREEPTLNQRSSAAYYDGLVALASGNPSEAISSVRPALQTEAGPDWRWQLLTIEGNAYKDLEETERALGSWVLAMTAISEPESPTRPFKKQHQIRRRRSPYEQAIATAAANDRLGVELSVVERLHGGTTLSQDELSDFASLPARMEEELRGYDALAYVVTKEATFRVAFVEGEWSSSEIRISRQELRSMILKFVASEDIEGRRRLSELLLGPHTDSLGSRPLLVVPDRELEELPFSALPAGDSYLIQMTSLGLIPAFSAGQRLQPPSTGLPLFLADAEGDLPAAREEARRWSASFNGRFRAGASATSSTLVGVSTPLLHVSVHGSIDRGRAALALADQSVSAEDILASSPHVDTVVLASCRSLTRRAGDIWTGIPGAFIRSGSNHVVATLWSVDDNLARTFVDGVYGFSNPGAPSPQHVAMAQRSLIDAGFPMKTWASFASLGRPVRTSHGPVP